jgi:hypothetical protein
MPRPDDLKSPPYYSGPKKVERGTSRLIEPYKTYRVPRGGKTTLLRIQKVGTDTLTVKDMQTDKISTISRQSFQNDLDNGRIYVSSSLISTLQKLISL